ncbi:MAG: alkyl hydroperoxide reductase subunit [Pseudomonadota bacterium]|jgi:alkyl hydroperoxide reductase subunit F
MLDEELKIQLRDYFAKIENNVELRAPASAHPQQGELLEMLNAVADCSDKISVSISQTNSSAVPSFEILSAGQPSGAGFVGIPGGHEFSSLVLAILNAGGAGRAPDAALKRRMQQLGRRASIRTYVSLSCENCPDVVQAMNQIAIFGGQVEHVMVEGGMVQEELARLNIQGVPAVFIGDKLIHSGRGSLLQLLEKLETELGTKQTGATANENLGQFDVVVLGGGPAGVSAAIYSARKGLKTALVAERLGGQVNETKGIENMISVLYTEGPQLAAGLNTHLRSYPVDIFEHRKFRSLSSDGRIKSVGLDSGESLSAEQVIVATGAKWRTLNVSGEAEYLGRGVAYCPHCDGPFFKDKKVAVIGGGNSGVEAAIDLAGICSEVVLIEFAPALKADQVLIDKLNSLANVSTCLSAKTTRVLGDGNRVTGLEIEDRNSGKIQQLSVDGIFVQIGLIPNSEGLRGVVELSDYGEIQVDGRGRTSTRGIYAAGDVTTTPYKQIIIAMGEGAKVALSAFEDRMRGEGAG